MESRVLGAAVGPSVRVDDQGAAVEPAASVTRLAIQPGARLAALDAFRGLTILGMLLVNNTALDTATPAQLTHAQWSQGIHFADVVFPWFLLIVGVAIPYSIASQRAKGIPAWRSALRVLSRAIVLVLLGCLVDSSLAKRPMLGLGVLQIIGLAYAIGAALYWLPPKFRLPAAALLLLGHWAVLRLVIVPGVEPGVLSESGNVVRYLDDAYLRPLHLRGLVSVVPTSTLVVIGSAIGDLLRSAQFTALRRFAYVAASGSALVAMGWLCSLDLPFSKAIWTASYVLLTAGLGCILLAALYLIADVIGWRRLVYPLVVPGTNAIFAYVAPILVKVYILQGWSLPTSGGASSTLQQAYLDWLIHAAGRNGGGWLYTISYLAFWWLVLAYMHRKRILLRV